MPCPTSGCGIFLLFCQISLKFALNINPIKTALIALCLQFDL